MLQRAGVLAAVATQPSRAHRHLGRVMAILALALAPFLARAGPERRHTALGSRPVSKRRTGDDETC